MSYSGSEKDIHRSFMLSITSHLNEGNKPYYLKGGTALLLCYGLDRFSEDLDFNSDIKLNIKPVIEKVAKKLNIKINSIIASKDTDTVQRFKVHYNDTLFLKIETSFREDCFKDFRCEKNGIQTYLPKALISMKIEALKNRTTARDLHDCIFLLERYKSDFTQEQIDYLSSKVIEDGFSTHFSAYRQDPLLKDFRITDMAKLENLLDDEISAVLENVFSPKIS